MNIPAMERALEHHPEIRDAMMRQRSDIQKFLLKTRKKFAPLYKQFESMMGHLMKMNAASTVITKTLRVFMAAASRLVEMIAGKAQAMIQKAQDAKLAGLKQVSDMKQQACDKIADVREAGQNGVLASVAQYFEGLQELIEILEDVMDKLESGTEDATSSISGKFMSATNGVESVASGLSGNDAFNLAKTLRGVSDDKLQQMIASAVAKHICPGGGTASNERLNALSNGFVESDLVSLFMMLASMPAKQ
eukprot:SAG11_NODE_10729_length_809_cov_1.356338_1_plen_248_part_10